MIQRVVIQRMTIEQTTIEQTDGSTDFTMESQLEELAPLSTDPICLSWSTSNIIYIYKQHSEFTNIELTDRRQRVQKRK
jgi:hypothetical protein